jgi:hypothetical protein
MMDREQTIEWAREAGMVVHEGAQDRVLFDGSIVDSLNRFAKLVANHVESVERESIALLIEKRGMQGYGTLAIAAEVRIKGHTK